MSGAGTGTLAATGTSGKLHQRYGCVSTVNTALSIGTVTVYNHGTFNCWSNVTSPSFNFRNLASGVFNVVNSSSGLTLDMLLYNYGLLNVPVPSSFLITITRLINYGTVDFTDTHVSIPTFQQNSGRRFSTE